MKEAYLTHPFHCCAFKHPSQHDPQRHAQQKKDLLDLQNTCIAKGFFNSEKNYVSGFVTSDYRKKRDINNKSTEISSQLTDQTQNNGSNDFSEKAITGLPLSSIETLYESTTNDEKSDDFGEFHNNSAQINSALILEALCGNLSQE